MLGVLEETSSSELFTPDAGETVRPGKEAPFLVAAGQRQPESWELVTATVLAGAEKERDRAQRIAVHNPSATTLAALAQTHAVLGENNEALAAARQALALSLKQSAVNAEIADPAAARLAAEVMLRFDAAEEAFVKLSQVVLPRSLRLTLAALAVELGRLDIAMDALEGQDGPLVESFRGFVFATQGDYQKAIPHLRAALRESPEDVAAAMNLSVSLWQLGSRRKAVAAALRATRTAPGRQDASLCYLELLLETGSLPRLTEEIEFLNSRKIVPDARLLRIQARAFIAQDQIARALPLLDKAASLAGAEGDEVLRVEIEANVAVLKYRIGRQNYAQTLGTLSAMLKDDPGHEAVVLSFARTASRSSDVSTLRSAVERIESRVSPARCAYLRHQVAWLAGDNEVAGSAASAWFDLEPSNSLAATAAMVALGIGLERWEDAQVVADFALKEFPNERFVINNAAYVLAMSGRADEAIRLLESLDADEFVLKATLGLAYLASGDIERGMRLYREAAEGVGKAHSDWLCLMTTYQAIVVRQLGIDKSEAPEKIAALALAAVPLPIDWEQHPEFLRLRRLCQKLGYDWPPSL